MTDTHFVYQLIPPRPTFALDMADDERAIMGQHAGYWSELLEQGPVVVFGAVLDPSGTWGLAVVEAESIDAVRALADGDPAVRSQLCTFDVFPMVGTMVRPLTSGMGTRGST